MKNYIFILLFLGSQALFLQSNAQKGGLPALGVATSFDNDSLLAAAGFDYIEESARKLLAPSVEETTYRKQLKKIKGMKLAVPSCNLFLPGSIRLTGPEANEKVILGFVDSLMQRAQEAGVKIIVFGSSGSRRLLDGQDPAQAKKELIAISRKMAEVAKRYDRIIAIENLNSTEDNFINRLSIVTEIVKAVDHPNFRITADIYHMKMENESPDAIIEAAPYLVHCHIAEKQGRTAPGKTQDDFVPYLKALKKVGYKGRITIECRWTSLQDECKSAHDYLQRQLVTAYNIK